MAEKGPTKSNENTLSCSLKEFGADSGDIKLCNKTNLGQQEVEHHCYMASQNCTEWKPLMDEGSPNSFQNIAWLIYHLEGGGGGGGGNWYISEGLGTFYG